MPKTLFQCLIICVYFLQTVLPKEIEIALNSQYISGIIPDYNLCQIFRPISEENDQRLFYQAVPNEHVSKNVRYIVIHKCRWSTNQDTFYGPFLDRSFECEDTRFVQVSTKCILYSTISHAYCAYLSTIFTIMSTLCTCDI